MAEMTAIEANLVEVTWVVISLYTFF